MKKVLIYPGAFNPPHNGHTFVVKNALSTYKFDELWIVPSGKREDKSIDISYNDRYALNKLFVDQLRGILNIPIIFRSDELDNQGKRYTNEVLRIIKSEPDIDFIQLIGVDGYIALRDALEPSEFTKEKFLVVPRKGYTLSNDTDLDKGNIFLNTNMISDISSSLIRSLIKNGSNIYEKLVSPEIGLYIKRHHLYT